MPRRTRPCARSTSHREARHGATTGRFVHGTYLRLTRSRRLTEVGAVPSFLTTGVTTGGDAVLRLWGPDRASRAMAAQTLSQARVPFTFSHDAPVTPQPWILPLVDAGVIVPPRAGTVVARLSASRPTSALRAVTASAALPDQGGENKGTLEAGKLADLVILERNPLEVESGDDQGHSRRPDDQGRGRWCLRSTRQRPGQPRRLRGTCATGRCDRARP